MNYRILQCSQCSDYTWKITKELMKIYAHGKGKLLIGVTVEGRKLFTYCLFILLDF